MGKDSTKWVAPSCCHCTALSLVIQVLQFWLGGNHSTAAEPLCPAAIEGVEAIEASLATEGAKSTEGAEASCAEQLSTLQLELRGADGTM